MTHKAGDEPFAPSDTDAANRDLVERFVAASERGDASALIAMVD